MYYYQNDRWWLDTSYCVEHESYRKDINPCECWLYMDSLIEDQEYEYWRERLSE